VPVRSCLLYAIQAEGHSVTTAEGLRNPDGSPGALMDSFMEAHGLQCGYCTPGMLISAHALLSNNKNPTDDDIREAIGGNLCRCTGYAQIVESIKLAAERLK
jgi:carbon-monoxide dehydrogenase small subunit